MNDHSTLGAWAKSSVGVNAKNKKVILDVIMAFIVQRNCGHASRVPGAIAPNSCLRESKRLVIVRCMVLRPASSVDGEDSSDRSTSTDRTNHFYTGLRACWVLDGIFARQRPPSCSLGLLARQSVNLRREPGRARQMRCGGQRALNARQKEQNPT